MLRYAKTITMVAAIVLCANGALAQCVITGDIVAAPSGDPLLPAWQYTLTVDWDTGSMFGVSHVNLLLDGVDGTCACADFTAVLTQTDPAGTSQGHDSGSAGMSGPCNPSG